VLVALEIAALAFVIGRFKQLRAYARNRNCRNILGVGSADDHADQSFMERWVGLPRSLRASESFRKITTLLTWIGVAAFAGMTLSSSIPPLVQGDATILDTKTPLSFVCYWVIPHRQAAFEHLPNVSPAGWAGRSPSFDLHRRGGRCKTPMFRPLSFA
jgi:hypothetical protein